MREVDVLVVGAGFAGAVIAERLASGHGLRCLVIDRRGHVGGMAHDGRDAAGVLLHSYGPHYFRTSSEAVQRYLSRFTAWRPVEYRVLSWTHGRYWSFPINLTTFEQLLGRPSTPEEMEAWLARWRVLCAAPRSSAELVLSRAGRRFFELFYAGYTRKVWGREARELDASVCGRIPVRTTRDDRYLEERFQGLPRDGYTALFCRLLDQPRIELLLGAELRAVRAAVRYRHLVYTGPMDEYFDHRLGPLSYRSLRFERQTLERRHFQPAVQVNYPNDHDFARIVELKHATGQELPVTTIVREYPQSHAPGRDALYPMPTVEARLLHARYVELAARQTDVTFVGRLASYRHLNMDEVVQRALDEAERLGLWLRAAAVAR